MNLLSCMEFINNSNLVIVNDMKASKVKLVITDKS